MQLHKICTKCGMDLPLSEYYKDIRKKHGYMARCKECKLAYDREHRKKTASKQVMFNKRRYWKNRRSEQERHLVRKYGITIDGYDRLLNQQSGKCAICGADEPKRKRFDVDHDHKTGKVRGLLCTSCNRMLGYSGDNPSTLVAGAKYLESNAIVPQVAAEFIMAFIETKGEIVQ